VDRIGDRQDQRVRVRTGQYKIGGHWEQKHSIDYHDHTFLLGAGNVRVAVTGVSRGEQPPARSYNVFGKAGAVHSRIAVRFPIVDALRAPKTVSDQVDRNSIEVGHFEGDVVLTPSVEDGGLTWFRGELGRGGPSAGLEFDANGELRSLEISQQDGSRFIANPGGIPLF
jgi:hypothetical protein